MQNQIRWEKMCDLSIVWKYIQFKELSNNNANFQFLNLSLFESHRLFSLSERKQIQRMIDAGFRLKNLAKRSLPMKQNVHQSMLSHVRAHCVCFKIWSWTWRQNANFIFFFQTSRHRSLYLLQTMRKTLFVYMYASYITYRIRIYSRSA